MNEKTEMPEEPEVPEMPEEKEHHPAKQSSGSSAAFLATAIALAAGGGTFYMWQQQQAMHKETQALEQSIDRLLSVVEERHKTELQRIDALAQHHHPKTEAQLARVETLVHDLRGRLGQERREWAVAEVEYLLRVADHRLTLEHDKDTALAALREARQRLALQEQDVYQPVIHQIDSDIDKLSSVSLPDRDRIATELATLSAAVEHWPYAIRETAPEKQPAAAPAATEAVAPEAAGGEEVAEKGWRKILAMIWSDIKSLVTIRHNGEVPRPLLEPEQHYFLQQNMQLKLQAARLALLGGNNRAYRDSLNEAAAWLQRYFDTSAPAVREAQATIEQLAEIDLEPALPTLGNSIELLQQAAMQIPPSPAPRPLPAAAPPAAPAEEKPAAKPAAPVTPAEESEAAPAAEQPATAKPAAPAEEQSAEPSLPAEKPASDVPALPEGNGL